MGSLSIFQENQVIKREWGARTSIRQELYKRNTQIYGDYLAGHSSQDLSGKYFLSLKSIQRIIREQKNSA